ncbi:MAG: hypothetical protein HY849_07895 [Nitrosomonadales bacterium]|nr:hypothetical protein [Nitrosomonadales bacterium]
MKYVTGILLAVVLQGCMMVGPGKMMHDGMMGHGQGGEHTEKSDTKDSSGHEGQH